MKTVFRLTLWFIGILLMPGLQAATTQGPLVLGAERMDVITRLLKDKQVGLVINQTSILEKQQKHLLDALVEKGIQVKKVFAPEHGFRGTADAHRIHLRQKQKTDSRTVERAGRYRIRHPGCGSPFLYVYKYHALCHGSMCGKRCRVYRTRPSEP